MKIFVTGLTSSRIGGMEHHNLGNYIIAETMFQLLREFYPKAQISTSMQMSSSFYKRFDLQPCNHPRFWQYDRRTGLHTVLDIFRVLLWKIVRRNSLLDTLLLRELSSADLVVDFSGDIYGDNAKWKNYLEANARLFLAFMLDRRVAVLIGSPGPFSSAWRLWVAKKILPRTNLLTNREPLSTAMLAYVGIDGDHIYTTACPSVFFQAAPQESLPQNADFKRLFQRQDSLFGLILCGWNMPAGPFNKWPREISEFEPFIALIEYLLQNHNYRICVMSHQNATSADGNLIKGNDHRIIERLMELLRDRHDPEKLFSLDGIYDASRSKTIISSFDVVMSGRIHGAVQAMSQAIPTAIIDYGHKPKAHKLRGFARVYGVDDFVCDPCNKEDLIATASALIENRDALRKRLEDRVRIVKASATRNFELLKSLSDAK